MTSQVVSTLDEVRKDSQDRLREELLERYTSLGPLTRWRGLKFRAKTLVWKLVVGSTLFIKRAGDMAASGALLLLFAPLATALAALIRLESPGPVLFRQTRVGKHGQLFTMYKFRSMYIDAEKRKAHLLANNQMEGGVLFKMRHDPRVTRVGRIIRKLSLDELPQLWNVFLGDMSLVGPRPPLPSEVREYSLADRRRLEVTPGITCIWQVSGRSDIPFHRQVELDVAYIEGQSLWGDIGILLRTVPAVLFGRGAY